MLKDEGYKLMGAAFEVYNQLGYGMSEEIYQQSLEIELALRGIPFRRKAQLAIFYKGKCLETHYFPDLLVYQGHRILIPGKSAQNPFQEVFVPTGLQPFAADASF